MDRFLSGVMDKAELMACGMALEKQMQSEVELLKAQTLRMIAAVRQMGKLFSQNGSSFGRGKLSQTDYGSLCQLIEVFRGAEESWRDAMWRLQVAETRLPALKLSRELLAAAQAEDDLASEDALLQVLEAGFAELREIGDMTLRSLAVVFFARLTEGADMEHQGENCAFGTLRELCGSYEAEAQKALERLKQIFS